MPLYALKAKIAKHQVKQTDVIEAVTVVQRSELNSALTKGRGTLTVRREEDQQPSVFANRLYSKEK